MTRRGLTVAALGVVAATIALLSMQRSPEPAPELARPLQQASEDSTASGRPTPSDIRPAPPPAPHQSTTSTAAQPVKGFGELLRTLVIPADDPADPDDIVTYYGRLQTIDGQPVAGITVEVWSGRRVFALPVSDVAGLFSVELPRRDYHLITRATDRWRKTSEWEIDHRNEIILTLKRLGTPITAFGQVTRPNGQPLPGVFVSQREDRAHATTDGNGEYELQYHVDDDVDAYVIDFQLMRQNRGGSDRQRVSQDQHVNGTVRVDAVIETGNDKVPLVVIVIDEKGAPLEAVVSLTTTNMGMSSSTGADGHIERWVEPNSTWSIEASASPKAKRAYESKRIDDIETGDAGEEVVMQLDLTEHGALAGALVDPTGQPVAGFPLTLRSHNHFEVAEIRTEADGNFVFDSLAPDRHQLSSRGMRFRTSGFSIEAGATTETIVVADVGDSTLQGRIVDNDNQPIGGAYVIVSWSFPKGVNYASIEAQPMSSLELLPAGYAVSVSRHQTLTDANGTFALFGLADDVYSISVWINDQARGSRTSLRPQPATVRPGEDPIDILALPRDRGR